MYAFLSARSVTLEGSISSRPVRPGPAAFAVEQRSCLVGLLPERQPVPRLVLDRELLLTPRA